MNYGFLESLQTPDNYVLGGVGVEKKIINPTRNWKLFLPQGEIQKRTIETSSCTAFGTNNAIETLEKKIFGKTKDYSERFVAIGSGQRPEGNDPHTVCEFIRHNGLLEETVLPFTDEIKSIEEYLNSGYLHQGYLQLAKKWLKQRDFKHEWVFKKDEPLKTKQFKLMEALEYSPIGISVAAWHQDGDFYVKAPDEPDNHWALLVNGKQGESWEIFDSYLDDGQYIKKLDFDYNFQFAKLFILNEIKRKSFYDYLKRYLEDLFR